MTSPEAPGLWLEVRGDARIPLEGTGDLARLLIAARDGTAAPPLPRTAGFEALLPVPAATAEEPDWLRAAAMLEEEAACPGERLLAGTLAAGASWWRPERMRDAATALHDALGSEAGQGAAARGNLALLAALERLPSGVWVRLAQGATPP
jgi:hypothetical protein